MLGVSLGYTDGKDIGSDEGIKLGCTDGKVYGTKIGNVDIITLGIDIVTELGYLDGSFGGSNDLNIGVLFLGDSLGYIDGNVLRSYEGIELIFTDGKVFILVSSMQTPLTLATKQLRLP